MSPTTSFSLLTRSIPWRLIQFLLCNNICLATGEGTWDPAAGKNRTYDRRNASPTLWQYFLHKESCQYRWLDNVIFHFLSYSFNPCQATAIQPRFTWKLKDTSKSFSPYVNFTVNLYLYLRLTKVHQNVRTARSCSPGLGLQGRGKCNHIGEILFAIENFTQWELKKNAEHLTSTSRLAVWVLVCARSLLIGSCLCP